jgi:hypothetical protein
MAGDDSHGFDGLRAQQGNGCGPTAPILRIQRFSRSSRSRRCSVVMGASFRHALPWRPFHATAPWRVRSYRGACPNAVPLDVARKMTAVGIRLQLDRASRRGMAGASRCSFFALPGVVQEQAEHEHKEQLPSGGGEPACGSRHHALPARGMADAPARVRARPCAASDARMHRTSG